MSDTTETEPSITDGMMEIALFPSEALAHEYALVVLSMRQPCLIIPAEIPGNFALFVESDAVSQIKHEFHAYAHDMALSKQKRAKPIIEEFTHPIAWEIILLWMLALVSVFVWQSTQLETRIFLNSSIDVIHHREWWRPFTSLFFHADIYHLLGNLLSGIIFAAIVSRLLGPWLGITLILVAGTLANFVNDLLHQSEPFFSLGASTAVFAALGLICGFEFLSILKKQHHLPLAKTFAPIMGGLVFLGWLGMGSTGSNTDILGHVLGFTSGTAIGLLAEPFTTPPLPEKTKKRC